MEDNFWIEMAKIATCVITGGEAEKPERRVAA